MTPERKKAPRQMSAKQVAGVESPATVLLNPIHPFLLGDDNPDWKWWSHDGVLLGGLEFNGTPEIVTEHQACVMYLPVPVPKSWGGKVFGVVVEYESEDPQSQFQFRVHYGCGDPSELHRGESPLYSGIAGSKRRTKFNLDEKFIHRKELFRVTLEVARRTPHPVLVYGAWLEAGV